MNNILFMGMDADTKLKLTWMCDRKGITTPVEFSSNTLMGLDQYRTWFYDKENNIHVYVAFVNSEGEFESMDYGTIRGANQRKFEYAIKNHFHQEKFGKPLLESEYLKTFNITVPGEGVAEVEYFEDGYYAVYMAHRTIHFKDGDNILYDGTGLSNKVKAIVEKYLKEIL
ncbi:MAG: hypothetical protein JST75_09315 [Bacteroidetes bacterium]|nr:hypothetical protein [Bacteroidota bacterium]